MVVFQFTRLALCYLKRMEFCIYCLPSIPGTILIIKINFLEMSAPPVQTRFNK